MPDKQVTAITVEGFKSIRSQRIDIRDLNVLVGPNGGGKSNFIGALEMLGRIVEGDLSLFVGRSGGAAGLLFDGAKGKMRLELVFPPSSYRAVLAPSSADELVFEAESVSYHGEGHGSPWTGSVGRPGQRETGLHRVSNEGRRGSATAQLVIEVLKGCRVYHFHDTSANAPVKQFSSAADNLSLGHDASNLAAYLLRLRDDAPDQYDAIQRTVRLVAPFLRTFVLREERSDQIRLRWRPADSDRVFSANALSDGTLRFICLATLLLGPELPQLVVLDEPELGLHPYAITQLVGLLQQAVARGSQVLLATQSVTLMNQFELADLVVVERQRGESVFHRPEEAALRQWLDEYSLGELWEKNLLGGRPTLEGRQA